MKNMNRFVFSSFAAFAVLGVTAAPEISDIHLSQDARRNLVVTYHLKEDAIVALDVLTNGVSIGDAPLSVGVTGDAFKAVKAGDHTIVWKARKAWPNQVASALSVRLTPIALAAAPTWMDINLAEGGETHFYERESQLIGGSYSNDAYKTSHLLLKRIPAAGRPWNMGGNFAVSKILGNRWKNVHVVTLSEDFYIGVFELTQGQAKYWPAHRNYADGNDKIAAGEISYVDARGANTDADWPKDGHFVADGSLLKFIRDRSGQDVDLPTDAQWDFATRSYDELPLECANWRNDNVIKDEVMRVGWPSNNAARVVREVGLKVANHYGLHDTVGNIGEWVLDWCETEIAPATVIDPVGPEAQSIGSNGQATITTWKGGSETVGRCFRGGCVNFDYNMCLPSYRNWQSDSARSNIYGVRVCAPGTVKAN